MNIGLGLDVDADGRLVDDQDPHTRRKPFGEADLLLVAAREIANRLQKRGRAHLEFGDDWGDVRPHRIVAEKSEPARELSPYSDAGILQHAMSQDQALSLAILADVADAVCVNGFRDVLDPAGFASHADLAAGDRMQPEDAFGELGAA